MTAEGGFGGRGVFWVTVAMLLATSGVFPAVAAQEPYTVVMIPPYTRSDAGGDLVAVADHRAGFLAVYGAIVNAVDDDGAVGWAWIEMDHVLPEEAYFVDYEIALVGKVEGEFRGGTSMGAYARSSGGLEARASAPFGIVPNALSFRLQNPDGFVDEGTITLRVWVSAGLWGCGPPFSFLPCSFGAEVVEASVPSITVTVHPASASEPPNTPPTAAFVHECTNLACNFDATGSSDADGSIVGYAWDFGDGATATGATPSHVYEAEGNYGVLLTVTDDEGATDDYWKPVSVSNTPPSNTPPTANFTYSCSDLTCEFDGTSSTDQEDGAPTSYVWDFGDGSTGTGAVVSHSFAAAGTYAVALTVADEEGLEDTDAQDVTVSDSPPPNSPPVADFTFTCAGLACDFDGSGSSDADGSIVGYAWDFGDGATATGVATDHAYAAEGTYTVRLTVADDEGATDDESEAVTVSEPPPPPPEIHLDAHGYKEKGLQKADLTWTNATSALIDVVRDDVVIATTENDGAYKDHLDGRGQGSYVYQVCEAGTATCSNQAVVEF